MVGQAILGMLAFSVGLVGWCAGCSSTACAADAAAPATRPSGVAVVEMFTSQGCSSCPAAEKVLAEITRAAARDGRPVLTLAFHVDYWNRLGWADRFSSPAFSQRQDQYGKALKLNGIYTPQMVVNGRRQFVGSDREAASRAITEALREKPAVSVTTAVQPVTKDGYQLTTTIRDAGANDVVNITIVEQGLSTEVKRGENAGSTLEEPSVVRWFKSIAVGDAGSVTIPPLAEVRPDRASVIVYVQRAENGPIVGAATAPLR